MQAREEAAASAAERERRDAARVRAESAARVQRLEAAQAAVAAREVQLQERERALDAQARQRLAGLCWPCTSVLTAATLRSLA